MDFYWPGTLVIFLLISLQHTDLLKTRATCALRFTTKASKSTIISSIGSTEFLELPANITPASRPTADQGHWWLQIHLMKGLRIYHSEFQWLHSALPILFYNIRHTVLVTLNQCTFIFYLVVCVLAFLDHLIFHTVDFLLHNGTGSYGFTCTLFQF